jgi:hypothetical protein
MVTEMKSKLDHLKATSTEKIYTKAWIKSFFGGYSVGIKERIKDAQRDVINEFESQSTSLALVLRDKQHVIEDYWQQLVRGTGTKRKLTSLSGFRAGKESADNADLKQNKIEE